MFYSLKPDGELDPTSLHGSCPTLAGNKWSATKWIHIGPFGFNRVSGTSGRAGGRAGGPAGRRAGRGKAPSEPRPRAAGLLSRAQQGARRCAACRAPAMLRPPGWPADPARPAAARRRRC
jgi:hypothetical protein